ncbi:MAG: hypothetical protein KAG19_07560 [Methylococcales bacterium]|nr:hypothetical protein [Methylococcales bacterium]
MSIQQQFILRHQSEGYVRFEIPKQFCTPSVAEMFTAKILKIEGVYHAKVFKKQQKLSIRYQDITCEFKQLATQLFQLIADLEQQGALVEKAKKIAIKETTYPVNSTVKDKIKNWKASRWVSEKYNDAKETAQAVKILSKVGFKKQKALIKDPEKAMIDFFNDILVLYLIKLHWTRITQEWMPKPWAFKYQWTALFYLFYLLLRSRRPK